MFGVRLDEDLETKLAATAQMRGVSKSELARAAIRDYLERDKYIAEAQAASRRIAAREAEEQEIMDFIEAVQDTTGWS